MSLTTALGIAQSSLFNTSRQTSVVSKNISNANNPNYTRQTAVLSSAAPGATVVGIQRAANEALFRHSINASSSYSGQSVLQGGLDKLALSVNGVDNQTSLAKLLGDLQTAMQTYSAQPSNRSLASNAVEAARQVVIGLNNGSLAIQAERAAADQSIATAVSDLNTLLSTFKSVNATIINGTRSGADISDALDQRDSLLKEISQYVEINAVRRADNDMMLTTKDGTMLFDVIPREITFQPNLSYTAGMTGNPIYIDGVPLIGGSGGNTSASGELAALVQLRDTISVSFQNQLDEMARGLVTTFAETDPAGLGAPPDAPGLFTWPGAPAMPAAGTLSAGLAASITLNSAFDANAGGNPELLRDGGANGAGYVHNASGSASFSDHLLGLIDKLDAPIAFDPTAGLTASASVMSFSTDSVGWLEGMRREASMAIETKSAVMLRTEQALSNFSGVNMDQEMAMLLELENSYQAASRLISVVDEMLAALMDAVR